MTSRSFQPGTGKLFGVSDINDELVAIDTATGAGTVVGSLGISFEDSGLAFDGSGNLLLATPDNFYSVDPGTGAATLIGSLGQGVTGLSSQGGTVYGLGGNNSDNLVTINTRTGTAISVGDLINVSLDDGGVDFDPIGTLWGLEDQGDIFTINLGTGEATLVSTTLVGFESLAIVPEPGSVWLLAS